MSEFIVWAPLVAVIGLALWFITQRKQDDKVPSEFLTALDDFGTQVQESSLQLNTNTERVEAALAALIVHLESLPGDTHQDVNNLRVLWEEMASQIDEFNNQPSHSTLQSSILTTRIQKHKEAIQNLVKQVRDRHPR